MKVRSRGQLACSELAHLRRFYCVRILSLETSHSFRVGSCERGGDDCRSAEWVGWVDKESQLVPGFTRPLV